MKKAVLFGCGPIALEAARMCKANDLECVLVTGPRQISETDGHGRCYVDLIREVADKVLVVEKLYREGYFLCDIDDDVTFGMSFGSPFVFGARTIRLFGGLLFNMHNTPLPEWRGGASYSWMIMQGCRDGATTIHMIDEGLDTGGIIVRECYEFPEYIRMPEEYQRHAIENALPVLRRFIDDLAAGLLVSSICQKENGSSYYPRLSHDIHSFIDWRWSGPEIERFVLAFSRPYAGARTQLNGNDVRIKDCTFESGALAEHHHPFASGLVVACSDDEVRVKVAGGLIRIPNTEIISDIGPVVGDRFHTPLALLEEALKTRVIFTPRGMSTIGK